MGFTGFGEYVVDFFEGLAADNSKIYWQANKARYIEDAYAPMEALLTELEAEFGPGKIFRPRRDTRFTHDKTPYKTHCGAVVEQPGGPGAFYVEVSAEGLVIGGGAHSMTSDQVARYRAAVDHDLNGPALERAVAELVGQGWFIHGNVLKTKPRGFPADHQRIELLRHRSIFVLHAWDPDDALHDRTCLRRVRTGWRAVRSINEWFTDHVGIEDT